MRFEAGFLRLLQAAGDFMASELVLSQPHSFSFTVSLSSFTCVCENYRRLAKCKVNCGYAQKIQTNKMYFFAFIFIYNKSALIPPERRCATFASHQEIVCNLKSAHVCKALE